METWICKAISPYYCALAECSALRVVGWVRLRYFTHDLKRTVGTHLRIGVPVAVSSILCGVLRYAVGEEFSNIPLFGISVIGIVSGIIVGVVTVLLAARSPANQAAKVSPVAAVSGNSEHGKMKNHTFHARSINIETALGIHHATSAKKNLLLMTGSFALSIIHF